MEEARRREVVGVVILLSRSLSKKISLYKLHYDMMIRMTGDCGGLSPVLDRLNISHPVSGWHSETRRSSLTHHETMTTVSRLKLLEMVESNLYLTMQD